MRNPPSRLAAWILALPLVLAAGCGGGGGGGADPGAGPAPGPGPSPLGIVSVTPANNATGVPLDAPIRAVFNRDMDPASITLSTISIRTGGVPVTGSLKYGTLYEVTVLTGVRDASGNPLGSPYTWRFATEAPPAAALVGTLSFDGNSGVSYDAPTRTAALDVNARHPLAGIVVRAVQPSADNGVSVVAEDNAAATGSGAFRFQALVPGKQMIVAEGTFPAGAVRRIMGVSTVHVAGSPILLELPMKDVTPDPAVVRLDAYCLDCHPAMDNVTRPGQIYRDAHKSGVRPPPSYDNSLRYDEYGWMTCESCHSVHYPTGFLSYALGSYQTLCNQCH